MPGNDSFTRGTLIPTLGAAALCLFALSFYTHVTKHSVLSVEGMRCITAEYLGALVGGDERPDIDIRIAPAPHMFEREFEREFEQAFRSGERMRHEAEQIRRIEEHVQEELERVQRELEARVRCRQEELQFAVRAPAAPLPPSSS